MKTIETGSSAAPVLITDVSSDAYDQKLAILNRK